MIKNLKYSIAILAGAVSLAGAGCSTTARLGDGQTLYTGVREIRVESAAAGEKVPGGVEAAATAPLRVRPNNPLITPWVRTPFPVGLWAWNSLWANNKRGLRGWLFRTFARAPVVMETDVQPASRVAMVADILENHGYFGSRADYGIFPQRTPQKARVGYRVTVGKPWFFETVAFPAPVDTLTRAIAALTAVSNVKPGLQYNVDTLAREQARIATGLRNAGWWWFRPEYLEYRADTTRIVGGVDLRMDVSSTAPPASLIPRRVGDVGLRIFSADGSGEADSMEIDGTKVWYQKPLRLRRSVIRRAMTLRRGEVATLWGTGRMLDNLTGLGVFNYVNADLTPIDSLRPADSLAVTVSAAMNTPMEMAGEADLAYKSSSFIGPALNLSISHGNIFRGGEMLSLSLVGSYEWQTGNTSAGANSTAVNSYELGLGASLVFPRMLVPGFMGRALRYGGRTSYTLGVDLLNRPMFFRMLSFNYSNTYDYRTSGTVTHSFTPFGMVYNNLLRTTPAFDAAMADNPQIALSFADQFIPSASYTFSFEKRFGPMRRDRLTLKTTLMSAGNVWAAGYALFGAGLGVGAKRLLGDPFSQFFKETAELRLYKQTGRTSSVALRLFAGAGHAYGNSAVLPYTEQFYIGGANSIRAYTIRSLGPGGYHSGDADRSREYVYFDQTGEMKLEMNAEFRFRIAGGLNGAVFVDAGNVWLLRDDPARPGGRIGDGNFFDRIATGTGAGLRYDLSFLVVRFDVGVGLHLPYATSRAGYYNIPRFRDGLGLHLAIGYPF
jgi:hypothetical protein